MRFLLITLCIGLGFAAQGQEDMMFTASKNSLVETSITVNQRNIEYKSPTAMNHNIGAFGEVLATNNQDKFTGFSIQLLTSNEALPEDANVFYFFGDVTVEKTNNKFKYIVGQFKTKQDAKKFMDTYLMEHYTKAIIIEYQEGKRK